MDLPLYELILNDEATGMEKVSFVKNPAFQRSFVAFSEVPKFNFKITDSDKRIVTGAAIIPDTPVYRKQDGMEFFVQFSADTIKKAAIKFMQEGRQMAVNGEHKTDLDGITLFEQFISDTSRGIKPPNGFEDLPDGTLYQSFYINNQEVWGKVKAGEFTGFSIEGYFDMHLINPAEKVLDVNSEFTQSEHEAFGELAKVLKEILG